MFDARRVNNVMVMAGCTFTFKFCIENFWHVLLGIGYLPMTDHAEHDLVHPPNNLSYLPTQVEPISAVPVGQRSWLCGFLTISRPPVF